MAKLIYLDNGATSYPKPEEVYTFMDTYYREFGVNPGRSGFDNGVLGSSDRGRALHGCGK